MKKLTILFLFSIILIMNSCVPPIRSITGRMPESTGTPGSGAVDAGTAYMVPINGYADTPFFLLEPQIFVSVHPKIDLDLNFVMSNIGTDHFSDAYLGSLGVHYYLAQRTGFKCSIGGGLMLGGAYLRTEDEDDYYNDDADFDQNGKGAWEFAFGGFFQFDYGVRFNNYVGMYFGNNLNLIYTDGWATAFYGVHSIGLQINYTENLYSSVEVGLAWNAFGKESGYPFSFGPAITLLGYNW